MLFWTAAMLTWVVLENVTTSYTLQDNKEAASAQQHILHHAGSGDRATEYVH